MMGRACSNADWGVRLPVGRECEIENTNGATGRIRQKAVSSRQKTKDRRQ